MRGIQAIPELLRRSGQNVVFSMLGGTNAPWIAQGVLDGSLRLVKTRHENTAVGAAAGFSRATGTVGLCSVTRGPGFTNCVNALVVATQGHVPLLLIVGESPTEQRGSVQNIDQRGLTATIGAGFHHVEHAEELEHAYWSALEAARWNGNPQVLSVKSSLLGADVPLADRPPPLHVRPAPPRSIPDIVDILERARRPLILAGCGVLLADCQEDVEALASLAGAHLATTLRANAMFEGQPGNLGLCGGWAPPDTRSRLAEADAVLALGTSLNDFVTAGGSAFPEATIVHCEIDANHDYASVVPHLVVHGDVATTCRALIQHWRAKGLPVRGRPVDAVDRSKVREAVRSVDVGHDPARGLDPREVYIGFDDLLPDDRVVVTDTGRFIGTLPSLLRASDARSWLVGNSFQSVGQGLGLAIGAATAFPDRPVVLFCGDGGFTMALADIEAVTMNALSLTVVVINDQQYGSEVHHLERYGLPADIARQPMPDVQSLAAAFGGRGMVVTTLDELATLDLAGPGLRIVDVRVDPLVNVRDVTAAWMRDASVAAPTGP